MTSKNNPFRRLGKLLHHARNHQKLSLFEASNKLSISVPQLISIEESRMKFYEDHPVEAITIASRYAQYLGVDAHALINEISTAKKQML